MKRTLNSELRIDQNLWKNAGKDILRVANVQYDESGVGFYVDGWDQLGRRRRHYINVHDQPVYMPELQDVVVGERSNNQISKITGRVLTGEQFRSLNIQPGDWVVAGPKRVLFFTEEFIVKNRSVLDELTNGGGHNLLLDSALEAAGNFQFQQGTTNFVEWVQEGLAGQDGSLLFHLNVPGDPVIAENSQSHGIVGGTFTLSGFVRSGNWRTDDQPAANPAAPSELHVTTFLETTDETHVRSQQDRKAVKLTASTKEAAGLTYEAGDTWYRPYGSFDLIDVAGSASEAYVVTYGFESRGHYLEQLSPMGPNPQVWNYAANDISLGTEQLVVLQGKLITTLKIYDAPTILDAEFQLQASNSSFFLFSSYTDASNYEGYQIGTAAVAYVRLVAGKRILLGTWAVTIPVAQRRFYRVEQRANKSRLTIGTTRAGTDTFIQPLQVENGVSQIKFGILAVTGDILVSVFDLFQPYTQQLDNVQLERGESITGWERGTNDHVNVDDLINRINDLPQDGSTIIADRIGAGTIVGREVIIANKPVGNPPGPVDRYGIIRSSNFKIPVLPPEIAGRVDLQGPVAGWLILGDGKAWFQDVVVEGTIRAHDGFLDNLDITGTLTIEPGGSLVTPGGDTLVDDDHLHGENVVFPTNIYDQDSNTYSRNIIDSAYRFITGSATTHIGFVDRNSYAFVQMTFNLRYNNLAGNTTDNSDYVRAAIFYGVSSDTADGAGNAAGLEQHHWMSGVGNVRTGATNNYAVVVGTAAGGPPYDEGLDGDPIERQYVLFARIALVPGIDYYVFPKFVSVHLSGQPYKVDQYQCMAWVQAR